MQVYKNSSNVDDYLVESITRPAQDPNAGEVYYRCMTASVLVSHCMCCRIACIVWHGRFNACCHSYNANYVHHRPQHRYMNMSPLEINL